MYILYYIILLYLYNNTPCYDVSNYMYIIYVHTL